MSSSYRFIPDSSFLVRIRQQTGAYSVVPDDSVPEITDLSLSSELRFGYPMTYNSRRVLPFHQNFRYSYDSELEQFVRESPDNSQNRLQIISTQSNSIESSILLNSNSSTGSDINSYRIVSKGYEAVTNLTSGLYSLDGSELQLTSKTYGLIVLDRETQNIIFSESYDLESDSESSNTLANKLNSYDDSVIVIIITDENPKINRSVELLVAMFRCGASYNIYGSDDFKSTSGYVLVGIPGQGEGTGLEYYTGDITSVDALLDIRFTINKGVPQLFTRSSSYNELIYTTDYWNKCVYVIQESGSIETTLQFTSPPYNISIGKLDIDNGVQDFLVVSFPELNKVRVYNPLNNYSLVRDITTEEYPLGTLINDRELYVACYKSHTIQKFTIGSDLITTKSYNTDYGIVNLIASSNNSIFASAFASNFLYVIPYVGLHSKVIVGNAPLGMTLDSQGFVVVTNSSDNSITRVNPQTLQVISTYDTGDFPTEVTADSSGQLYVLCKDEDAIQVIRSNSGEFVTSFRVQRTGYGLNHSSVANRIYLSSYVQNYKVRSINPHNSIRNNNGKYGSYEVYSTGSPTLISSSNSDVPIGAPSKSVWLLTSKTNRFGKFEYCTPGSKVIVSANIATPSNTAPDILICLIIKNKNGDQSIVGAIPYSKRSYWDSVSQEIILPENAFQMSYAIFLQYEGNDQTDFNNRWYVTNVGLKSVNAIKMLKDVISTEPLPEDTSRWNPEVDYGEIVTTSTKIFKASEHVVLIADGRRPLLSNLKASSVVITYPKKQLSITELVANSLSSHETYEYNLLLGKYNELIIINAQSGLYITGISGLPRGISLSKDRKVLYGIMYESGSFEVNATLSNNRSLKLILKSVLYRVTAKSRIEE